MKSLFAVTLLMTTPSAHAIKLSHNLFGEWRENCLKALDLQAKEETAPFVMYKMVVGWDGTMEYNYSYYKDAKCTERKSQKREYAKYKVLESHDRRAKLLVRKELEGGLVSENIVEISLPSINHMSAKVLSTKIQFDDLLSDENVMEGVTKDSGAGEAAKKLSRHIDEPKKVDAAKKATI